VIVTVYSVNQGDGSSSVRFLEERWDVENLIKKYSYKYSPEYAFEALGGLEDPLTTLTFEDEEQMEKVLGDTYVERS
jgi:hypothetical protein